MGAGRGVPSLGAARFGHALEAFRLLGRHASVTVWAVLDQLVEGSRSGHPEEAFGLLRRHTLVTFPAVLVRLWGAEASCPKGAAFSLLQEARRDQSVPWKPRAQKVPPFLFRKRRGVTKVCPGSLVPKRCRLFSSGPVPKRCRIFSSARGAA